VVCSWSFPYGDRKVYGFSITFDVFSCCKLNEIEVIYVDLEQEICRIFGGQKEAKNLDRLGVGV
jgi:hypothetical protein